MEFYKQILPVAIDRKDKRNIVKALSKDFNAVTEGASDIVSALVSDVSLHSSPNTWEIFRDKYSGCILYVMIPQHHRHIEAGCIAHKPSEKRIFEAFKQNIKKALSDSIDVTSVRWRQFLFSNERFSVINSDSSAKFFSGKTKPESAAVLRDAGHRNVLRVIGEAEQISSEAIAEKLPGHDIFMITDDLVRLGLISKNFCVYCRQTSQLISRVNDIEAIREASTRGLQCPFCGKTFLEERIEQILSITDEGRKFMQRNYWLSLFTAYTLLEEGIYQENISIRQDSDLSNSDIFVSHFGKLLYVAIKETPLPMESLFLFAQRAKFYGADRTVLITDEKISSESSMFLKNSVRNISVIDSIDAIESDLKDVLENMKTESASDSISLFGPISRIDLPLTVIDHFFKSRRDELIEVLEAAGVPERTSLSIGEAGLADGDAGEDEELIEEFISSSSFYSETEEPDEIIEYFPGEEYGFDGEEQSERTDEQSEPVSEQSESAEASNVGDEYASYPEIDDTEDDPEDELLMTENIRVDFQASDSVAIPELSAEAKAFEEGRQQSLAAISALLEAGNTSSYELEAGFGPMGSAGAVCFDDSGLVRAYRNISSDDADISAAYGEELLFRLSERLSEFTSRPLVSVFVDTPSHVFSLAPVKGGAVVFAGENTSDASELEAVSSADVRHPIAEKVFDSISRIDAVTDLALINSEGEFEISYADSVKSPEQIKPMLDFFSENESLIKEFAFGENVRQFCVMTEYTIYSFVFFTDGTVFLALLDAGSGREIWNLKIMESAMMIA